MWYSSSRHHSISGASTFAFFRLPLPEGLSKVPHKVISILNTGANLLLRATSPPIVAHPTGRNSNLLIVIGDHIGA